MIIVTKFMDKTARPPARVQASVLGPNSRKLSATVPWRSTLHSAHNHRRALGKLLKRLRGSGDVKDYSECAQIEIIGTERYWAVRVTQSTVRWVDDIITYFEETTNDKV